MGNEAYYSLGAVIEDIENAIRYSISNPSHEDWDGPGGAAIVASERGMSGEVLCIKSLASAARIMQGAGGMNWSIGQRADAFEHITQFLLYALEEVLETANKETLVPTKPVRGCITLGLTQLLDILEHPNAPKFY
jgi:hypothetical protein